MYESLLDLQPRITPPRSPGGFPAFSLIQSSQRKETGSYYTPSDLVRELVSSALAPVISDRMQAAPDARSKEGALLSFKVVDPACGSGHFLLAAARRIATDLAQIRAGEDGATPAQYREALREVISSCIYGVDKNPLAVDLCKVALWIEGHDPGRTLSFLDHHIRCGDSLVGVLDLDVLSAGLPAGAFKAVGGDDKEVVKLLGNRNRQESRGQLGLRPQVDRQRSLAVGFHELGKMPADDPGQVAKVRARYAQLRRPDSDWGVAKLACDLWTSAFHTPLDGGNQLAITTATVRGVLTGAPVSPKLADQAEATADRYRYFHWPLEFPDVFAGGGFDVVLGNPPWEKVTLSEKEFFHGLDDEIMAAPNKAARQRLIDRLQHSNPQLHRRFLHAKRDAEWASRYLRGSDRFALTGRGDINTYSVFVETGRSLLNQEGRVGMICPSGIATDNTTRLFFADLVETKSLASLLDFENREKTVSRY